MLDGDSPPVGERLILQHVFGDSVGVVDAADDVEPVVEDGAGRVEQLVGHRRQLTPGLLPRLRGQASVGHNFAVSLKFKTWPTVSQDPGGKTLTVAGAVIKITICHFYWLS